MRKTVAFAPVAGLLLSLCGCGGGVSSLAFWRNSKWRDPDIESPIERIERYRALADSAGSKSPAEQEATSGQLARDIAGELDPLVRAEIVRTLAHYPTPVSGNVLRSALRDVNADAEPTPVVRIAACEALGRRGGAESIRALRGALEDESNDVDIKLAAVRALGEIEDPAAVPALALGLEHSDPALRYRTMKSLENVTGRYYGYDVAAWRQFTQGVDVPQKSRSLAERLRQSIF